MYDIPRELTDCRWRCKGVSPKASEEKSEGAGWENPVKAPEAIERSTGLGKPKVAHCRGRLKADGSQAQSATACRLRRNAVRWRRWGAPALENLSAVWAPFWPSLEPRRNDATLNNGPRQGSRAASWETMEPGARSRRPEGLRGAERIVPNGREARHRTGRRGFGSAFPCFWAPIRIQPPLFKLAAALR